MLYVGVITVLLIHLVDPKMTVILSTIFVDNYENLYTYRYIRIQVFYIQCRIDTVPITTEGKKNSTDWETLNYVNYWAVYEN